ncbi:MAG TPA: hypothetical protein VHN15_00765 [Thermoanaerobaculia bacterium]|nr:hypothetical protein [Thermoanaerobaculia bacterium]
MVDYHERPDRPRVVRRISPSAVLAGAILALVTLFMLNLLGVGLGLTTIDPGRGGDASPGLSALGVGAAIWGVVTFLIALFAGGWVAGRLAGDPKELDSMLHGLLAWALAMLVLLWLMTTAVSGLIGGAFSLLGSAASATAQGVQAAVTGATGQGGGQGGGPLEQVSWQRIQQELEQALPAGVDLNRQEFMAALRRLLLGGGDRQAVVDILVNQGGMAPEEAQATVQDLENRYQQAVQELEQRAAEAAEATANAVSSAAIWAFIALALGGAAAAAGGWLGTPRDAIAAPEAH